MKPTYRSTGYALPSVASVTVMPHAAQTLHASRLQRIGASLIAWWRDHQQRRAERLRIEALTALDRHTLDDLGMSEEMRWRALAHRESQQERLERLRDPTDTFTSRFGL